MKYRFHSTCCVLLIMMVIAHAQTSEPATPINADIVGLVWMNEQVPEWCMIPLKKSIEAEGPKVKSMQLLSVLKNFYTVRYILFVQYTESKTGRNPMSSYSSSQNLHGWNMALNIVVWDNKNGTFSETKTYTATSSESINIDVKAYTTSAPSDNTLRRLIREDVEKNMLTRMQTFTLRDYANIHPVNKTDNHINAVSEMLFEFLREWHKFPKDITSVAQYNTMRHEVISLLHDTSISPFYTSFAQSYFNHFNHFFRAYVMQQCNLVETATINTFDQYLKQNFYLHRYQQSPPTNGFLKSEHAAIRTLCTDLLQELYTINVYTIIQKDILINHDELHRLNPLYLTPPDNIHSLKELDENLQRAKTALQKKSGKDSSLELLFERYIYMLSREKLRIIAQQYSLPHILTLAYASRKGSIRKAMKSAKNILNNESITKRERSILDYYLQLVEIIYFDYRDPDILFIKLGDAYRESELYTEAMHVYYLSKTSAVQSHIHNCFNDIAGWYCYTTGIIYINHHDIPAAQYYFSLIPESSDFSVYAKEKLETLH